MQGLAFFPGHPPDDTAPLTWGPTLHQVVVVKATGLMPAPLKRQILRHRAEILRGCLDVLREGKSSSAGAESVRATFREILNDLGSRVAFKQICYKLGRLSALTVEYASPLNGSRAAASDASVIRFRDFIGEEIRTFPLVVTREGEGYLRRGSLPDYLDYIARRNADRRKLLDKALAEAGGAATWRDQRSLVYGVASLLYNDLVLDSARIWLLLWQEAGGDTADAPYFTLDRAGGDR